MLEKITEWDLIDWKSWEFEIYYILELKKKILRFILRSSFGHKKKAI